MRWWRRRSLRARLEIIGVAGLCAGLALGGVALVAALGWVLQRSIDADAQRTAQDVAALVDAGALPQPVPVAGAELVQVVDSAGRVRSASADADRLVPMLDADQMRRARAGQRLMVAGDAIAMAGPVRIVAVPAGPSDDPQTVVVARSLADVARGAGLLRTTLLVFFPLLVCVLAVVAWRVMGATLRPVEELRRGAEEITGTDLAGRLPVPAGGDEIHRLAVTLNSMLGRIEAGRLRQREFVADAAHELRSPLANMRTQLEVAQRLGPAAAWPEVAEDVLMDTRRLARLVDDLLVLARADASGQPAFTEPVELGALVAEVAARYRLASLAQFEGQAWVDGDPDELRRIVANLLDNAVRYARSAVLVSVVAGGPWHVITVTDDGPGVPASERERVFERFTRLDESGGRDESRARDDSRGRDAGGAGLGLAIVRELVRQHRGEVLLGDAPAAAPAAATCPATPASPGLQVRVRLPPAHVNRACASSPGSEP